MDARLARYLGSDVVVETLHEAGDHSYGGQRGPAHFVLLEKPPDGVAAQLRHLRQSAPRQDAS